MEHLPSLSSEALSSIPARKLVERTVEAGMGGPCPALFLSCSILYATHTPSLGLLVTWDQQ